MCLPLCKFLMQYFGECRLWSAFHDHGRLYLLMDWHNGGQLFRLIQEHAPFGEANTRFYLAGASRCIFLRNI
jgi:hypothetical protein